MAEKRRVLDLRCYARFAMSRDYIARDPRTGRPINVGGGRKKSKRSTGKEGPWMAIPQQAVIPLATGEIDTYRVAWKEKDFQMGRIDGIKALSVLSGVLAHKGHSILLDSLMNDDVEVRIAGLSALPSVAETCPDELFDHLSVLLDDKDSSVRIAASECLKRVAPIFPSATESTLSFELRHETRARRDAAFGGLGDLCQTWPEVACDHIDELLQEKRNYLIEKFDKLLSKLNDLAGKHGIGRVDIVENRYVGIKSRGCYETPGGTIYHKAHRAIESITMDRELLHLKEDLCNKYTRLIYNGYWFSPERESLQLLIDNSQKRVSGVVKVKLFKGNIVTLGRKSPYSIYNEDLSTFEKDSGEYNQRDAEGFIKVNSLRLRNQ